jgi:AcrR family transcriptional regulator
LTWIVNLSKLQGAMSAVSSELGNGTLDETGSTILDAARAAILDFGVRRITLSDIAARAGVSRMTVYNRFGDLDAVVRALMTREFGSRIEWIAREREWRHGRERIVALLVRAARQLPANPLFRKVRASEPELLAPYVLQRLGGTQRIALDLITRGIAEGQGDGSVRSGDPGRMAAAALLIAQSFVFSAATIDTEPVDALLQELERALEGLLAPRDQLK